MANTEVSATIRSHLIPVSSYKSGFTTSSELAHSSPSLKLVGLSDKELGVHKVTSKLPHPVVRPPPSKTSAAVAAAGDGGNGDSDAKPGSSAPASGSKDSKSIWSSLTSSLPTVFSSSSSTSPSSASSASSPSTAAAPAFKDPTHAWQATYPKGSINPSAPIPGGFGFYVSGPSDFAKKLEKGDVKEVVMSYRMMLGDGWQWVKGGKLPGVFGGEGDLSYGCTGGRQDSRCKCFDLRLMWRPSAQGELYTYLPLTPTNHTVLSSVPPKSTKNNDYGYSVGRGAFDWNKAVGRWVSVAMRVKMNGFKDDKDEEGRVIAGKKVPVEDGEVEVWIDGESVIKIEGLEVRCGEGGKVKGMHFQTFFGGHTDEWASPLEQKAWFSDVTGVIVA